MVFLGLWDIKSYKSKNIKYNNNITELLWILTYIMTIEYNITSKIIIIITGVICQIYYNTIYIVHNHHQNWILLMMIEVENGPVLSLCGRKQQFGRPSCTAGQNQQRNKCVELGMRISPHFIESNQSTKLNELNHWVDSLINSQLTYYYIRFFVHESQVQASNKISRWLWVVTTQDESFIEL